MSPAVGPPSRARQRAPARAPRISDPARRARRALGMGVGPEGECGWIVWVGGAMGYEPECRVLGLRVLPPRVPPSRPARQASSARDRKKRLVKEDKSTSIGVLP